jgi:hypothetical protein
LVKGNLMGETIAITLGPKGISATGIVGIVAVVVLVALVRLKP